MDKLVIAIVFVCYLGIMLAIGMKFAKSNNNLSDYVLGGRKLGPWTSAMSAQASDMSGWLLLGLPGTAYALSAGTTEAIWTAIGLLIGTYLNWLIVAKRLRKYTQVAGDSVTLPEFFANRFHDKSGILRGASAVIILFFFTFYTASMFSAGAKLFNSVFGIGYTWALVIGVLLIVSYTFLGGFMAVCWTDLIQGVLMFIALIVVPIIAVIKCGGIDATSARLAQLADTSFSLIPKTAKGAVDTALIVSSLGWGLGYFGMPHILPRFMAIRSSKEIRPARIIATIWVIITLACGVIVGVVGKALYNGLPLLEKDPEKVFMTMVQGLFPILLAGILLTAILAAIMSTADSQLLVASSAVSGDLYNGLINKKASGKKVVWISRITVLVISLVAALLVCKESFPAGSIMAKLNASVFKLVSFAWAGLGAAFGPIVLFSLFWRRTTKQGALAGIIGGGVATLVWWLNDGGIFDLYEIIPGFVISAILIVVVSLCTKVDKSIVDEFDSVKTANIDA